MPSNQDLIELLNAGAQADALATCEQRADWSTGGSYYRFWRERLARFPARRQDAAQHWKRWAAEVASAFAGTRYQCRDLPLPPEAELAARKAELVAASPFKGDIYLPTDKLDLAEQVQGLTRVCDLAQKANMAVSSARFAALRRLVQDRGTQRIFVIGNGPSLKRTDLALLRDEVTIGFNGIFLHESFVPTIYVVEDHLVAEDRAREILAYDCPVKLFPAYLGYCIEPQDNTIFLNHRSRVSFPVDTDFSDNVGELSYAGGTVTYTGLQIAASLGVKEIVLLGVDASYQVHNVDRSKTYGVGVLTSKGQDTNHFDPRYFGAGFRWHDPNVHTMLQAYRKAREYGRDHGVRFVNATIGGQLEVFPRVDFHDLFPREQVWPRLAVLDFTSVRRLSATGIVKANLLQGWPKSSQLHVFADEQQRLVAFQNVPNDLYAQDSDASVWAAFRSLVEYDPQVLYLRPTLDRVPMTVLQLVAAAVLGRPWLVHYMDDWLLKARHVRPAEVADAYRALMGWVFEGAERVLSICPKMSAFLAQEYGLEASRVQSIHNFMPEGSGAPTARPSQVRVISYFGGLEADMGLSTVLEVARQVEALNRDPASPRLALRIVTSPSAIRRHGEAFARFPSTELSPQSEDYADYLRQVASSDLNLVCYNFDATSLTYVRYSLANKLPELLAAGAPFLAIGHADIGTIGLLKDAGYPWVLDEPVFSIAPVLSALAQPSVEQAAAWQSALDRLKDEFSVEGNRQALHQAIRRASGVPVARREIPWTALRAVLGSVKLPQAHTRDLEMLFLLPALPQAILAPALQRIRQHGRTWSVRHEFSALTPLVKDEAALPGAGDELKIRLVSFLVSSLGHERYEPVNHPIRNWLRHLAPAVDGSRS